MENLKVRRKNEIRTISELGQIVITLVKRKELKINAPIPDFFNKYYNL